MQPAIELPSSYANRSPGSRAVSAAAAIVLTGLLVWLLIRLGIVPAPPPPGGQALVTINLPPGEKSTQASKAPAKARAEQHKAVEHEAKAASVPKPIITPPPVAAKTAPWNVIWMSHDQMAAADITHMQGHHDEAAASGASDDSGSGDAGGAGGKPGPNSMFDADWYREPQPSALLAYLGGTPTHSAWGEIACRTAPQYHVVDCRQLAETPGSKMAYAMVEASNSFLVLPPRVNGHPLMGVWVRIRWDEHINNDDAGSAPQP